jgi:uncharacterized protein YqeY
MKLQEQIKRDLQAAMKQKDEEKKNTLRVVMGEMGRSDKKELSDDQTIKILKKLIKSEKELLSQKGDPSDSGFIKIIEKYLPQMVSEADIRAWIEQNIDFSTYKNKMQAMGAIMKHFGATADGLVVKDVLKKMV